MKQFITIELNDVKVDIDKKVFNKTFNCDIEMLKVEVEEWKDMVDKKEYFRIVSDEYREFRVFDIDANELSFDF